MKTFRYCIAFFTLAVSAVGAAVGAEAPARVVAIGDLHGDYGAFEQVITRAGLIDEEGAWAGGETVFVQTGDVPDRGPDTLQIIRKLQALQKEAEQAGGRVVTLIGNHEAMNVTGDLRYVHEGEYAAFVTEESERLRDEAYAENQIEIVEQYASQDPALSPEDVKAQWEEATPLGFVEHRRAWAPDGEVGSWVVNNAVVAIVGDSLFLHGGISAKYTAFTLDEINAAAAEELAAQSRDRAGVTRDPLGPLWYRGLHRGAGEEADSNGEDAPPITIEDELDLVLDAFDVSRIVVGHTVSIEGVKANHDGRVIQIDTGISRRYGGTNSFLEITADGIYANDNGVVTKIDD